MQPARPAPLPAAARQRRRLLGAVLLGAAGAGAVACTPLALQPRPLPGWLDRLRGDALVLLGEVHDNPAGHALRLQALQAALAAGWRPALLMEQFDRERQADIDRARGERPHDARHLIDTAGGKGWDWASYRPVIELALAADLPLLAANVSATDARKLVRGGYADVFDAAQRALLGLDQPRPADWQAAQERQIDLGHCGALPASAWPAMARAQFARDAAMAALLRAHSARGVLLLAGNGHVRRDIGVPRWLDAALARRLWSVGYLETPLSAADEAPYDAVVSMLPAARPDPCEALRKPAAPR